ncbi:MAG: hypothetical protein RLZZ230_853, partial [Candidatus Parcubacteria bacterium]
MTEQTKALETIVISIDGKLIVPDKIDTDFLIKLKEFIISETAHNRRFILIAGGGMVSRRYQAAAEEVIGLNENDLDWLGIHTTRLNGHLLSTILRDIAYPIVFTNPDDILDVPKDSKVVVAAGYRPGISTDLEAVKMAILTGASKVVNLSSTDYSYSNKSNTDSVVVTEVCWDDFCDSVPNLWSPDLPSPFDPIAANIAKEKNIEVAQINGTDLSRLQNYINNKPF